METSVKKAAYFFGVKLNDWFSLSQEERTELCNRGIESGFLSTSANDKGHYWNIRDTDIWQLVLPETISFINFECAFVAWLGTGKRNHYEISHSLDVSQLSDYIFQDDQLSELILGDISDDPDVLDNEIENRGAKYLRVIQGHNND